MKTDRMMRGMVLVCLISVLLIGAATGDTLETRAGELLTGQYMGGTQNSVRFQIGRELRTFPTTELLALTFMRNPSAAPAAAPPPAVPPAAPVEQATAEPNQLPPLDPTITAPSGTRLMVRLDQTLDSTRHGAGHMFMTSLETDLVVDGKKLAFRGDKVYGRLVSAKQGGRMAGKSELGVVVTDIMIKNIPHPIETTGVKAVSQGSGGSTVRNVAVGAGIGRLAKGTSKGAKRGAAVGLGASVLTSGSKVYIPAGTLMEFNLTKPFTYVP